MRYGSEAFYSTVATLLPIFAFLALYQRRQGFFMARAIPKPETLLRWRTLVRVIRGYYLAQAVVMMLLTFASLVAGEVLCLLALSQHGETAVIYESVWSCVLLQLSVTVLVEAGNAALRFVAPIRREARRSPPAAHRDSPDPFD